MGISWDEAYADSALTFAREHRLPIINETSGWGSLRFHLGKVGWVLTEPGQAVSEGFSLRFESRHAARGKDPLLRAIGKARTVLDLTAGWGADALHLARAGYSVVSIERNPVVYCLLSQAHAWLEDEALARRLRFINLDAALADLPDQLESMLDEAPSFDLVYLDPMFADKRAKTARARKPMQLMQKLAGEQQAANDRALLGNALVLAGKRVVVKRALRAAPISRSRLQGDIRSKLLRFDLYLP